MISLGSASSKDTGNNSRFGAFELAVFGVFALLLALVTSRHEMEGDSFQAWLIARDTHSLSQLLHVLRYEGHPTLWYLLLYLPVHISWNPAGMQIVNYLVALAVAWLILSARRLARPVRVLIVFSSWFFYQYGVIVRSYELAALLLIAAALCLFGEKKYPKLAILLLALAINTHALAVPLAVLIVLWGFIFSKAHNPKDIGKLFRYPDTWAALLILILSMVLSYLSARPAPDLIALDTAEPSIASSLIATCSTPWQVFFPYAPSHLRILLSQLYTPSFLPCVLSFFVCLVVATLLRTVQARTFFVACTLAELVAMALILGSPYFHHLGFFFITLVIALLIDTYAASGQLCRLRLSHRAASILLFALLGIQVAASAARSVIDWIRPFALANEASLWLRTNHLEKNPLVLENSEFAVGIVSNLERPSAYFPACHCFGSYEFRREGHDTPQLATLDDLRAARGSSSLPVILIANGRLPAADVQSLHLVEIHESTRTVMQSDNAFFIYQQAQP